jgi:hypothetical protein
MSCATACWEGHDSCDRPYAEAVEDVFGRAEGDGCAVCEMEGVVVVVVAIAVAVAVASGNAWFAI